MSFILSHIDEINTLRPSPRPGKDLSLNLAENLHVRLTGVLEDKSHYFLFEMLRFMGL